MMRIVLLALACITQAYAGGSCGSSWQCPRSWSTGDKAKDVSDAKAFTATTNIYRCMHNVQAALWDSSIYESVKDKASDSDNDGKTFPFSEHRGVDATHTWYKEIVECRYKDDCYQSEEAKNFQSIVWSSVNRIAYVPKKGLSKIAKSPTVARYLTCDGEAPDFDRASSEHFVPPVVKDYGSCLKEVLSCAAFEGLTEADVDGCDGHAKAEGNVNMPLTMKWEVEYDHKCKDKYASILKKYASILARVRLFNARIPREFQPAVANGGLVVLAAALLLAMSTMIYRRVQKSGDRSQVRSSQNLRSRPQPHAFHTLPTTDYFGDLEDVDLDERLA